MKSDMREITIKEKLHYAALTRRWGRAEFQLCPVFKYGKMIELYIYRHQQFDEEIQKYHLDIKAELKDWKVDTFHISAWSHLTEEPYVWRNFWCKEHKTICFEVYVPNNTNTLEFDFHFGDSLTMRFCQRMEENT